MEERRGERFALLELHMPGCNDAGTRRSGGEMYVSFFFSWRWASSSSILNHEQKGVFIIRLVGSYQIKSFALLRVRAHMRAHTHTRARINSYPRLPRAHTVAHTY